MPVVGPGLALTVDDYGNELPIAELIAPQLAEALNLANCSTYATYNDVAREYFLRGGSRQDLYNELGHLLSQSTAAPSATLLKLAAITDFELLISSTPDWLLQSAVAKERPAFSSERDTIRFHPNGISRPDGMIATPRMRSPCDLPDQLAVPTVYHILGDHTLPDFAVWEEDYMEFVCGLIEKRDTMPNFFQLLQRKNLLLLGAPSEDWIVRFFLRAARGKRLSDGNQPLYLADEHEKLGEPMVFFLSHATKSTQIIDSAPSAFVSELYDRWQQQHDPTQDVLGLLPDDMPKNSVFISYSHDDRDIALQIAEALFHEFLYGWTSNGFRPVKITSVVSNMR